MSSSILSMLCVLFTGSEATMRYPLPPPPPTRTRTTSTMWTKESQHEMFPHYEHNVATYLPTYIDLKQDPRPSDPNGSVSITETDPNCLRYSDVFFSSSNNHSPPNSAPSSFRCRRQIFHSVNFPHPHSYFLGVWQVFLIVRIIKRYLCET